MAAVAEVEGSHYPRKRRRYSIPTELPPLLVDMAREVLKHLPENIYEFLGDYVEGRLNERDKGIPYTGPGGSAGVRGTGAPGGALEDVYRRLVDLLESQTEMPPGKVGPGGELVGSDLTGKPIEGVVNENGEVIGPDGKVLGKINEVGELVSADGVVIGKVGPGGVGPAPAGLDGPSQSVGTAAGGPPTTSAGAAAEIDGSDEKVLTKEGPICSVNENGEVVGPDGMVLGKINEAGELVSADGVVIGKVGPNGEIVASDGKVLAKTGPVGGGELVGASAVDLSKAGDLMKKSVEGVVNENGEVIGPNGELLGRLNDAGELVSPLGVVIGKLKENGEIVGDDGKVLAKAGPVGKRELVGVSAADLAADLKGEPGQGLVNENGEVIENGKLLGRLNDAGEFVSPLGVVIGKLMENGEIIGVDGKVLAKSGPVKFGPGGELVGANAADLSKAGDLMGKADGGKVNEKGEVISPDGKVLGRLNAAGELISSDGKVIGKLTENGEIVRIDGKVLAKTGPGSSVNGSGQAIGAEAMGKVGPGGELRGASATDLSKPGDLIGKVDGGMVNEKGEVVSPEGQVLGKGGVAGELGSPEGGVIGKAGPGGAGASPAPVGMDGPSQGVEAVTAAGAPTTTAAGSPTTTAAGAAPIIGAPAPPIQNLLGGTDARTAGQRVFGMGGVERVGGPDNWVSAVSDFMDQHIGAIKRLLTGEASSEEARGTMMTLAISLVVGLVLGYAIKSSSSCNSNNSRSSGAGILEGLGGLFGSPPRHTGVCGAVGPAMCGCNTPFS